MRANASDRKRSINIYLNSSLLDEAKELDLNISVISNQALEIAVKEYRREHWIAENRAGIEALNGFVEDAGIFSDDEDFGVL